MGSASYWFQPTGVSGRAAIIPRRDHFVCVSQPAFPSVVDARAAQQMGENAICLNTDDGFMDCFYRRKTPLGCFLSDFYSHQFEFASALLLENSEEEFMMIGMLGDGGPARVQGGAARGGVCRQDVACAEILSERVQRLPQDYPAGSVERFCDVS